MIIGAHAIIYSKDEDADRAFVRDVLGFPHVDAGGGWLIFRLPSTELAVHPTNEVETHELYLMTDDVEALAASMRAQGIETSPISEQRWGLLTHIALPGGGKLGVYQPRHPSPPLRGSRTSTATRGRSKKESAPRKIPRRPKR